MGSKNENTNLFNKFLGPHTSQILIEGWEKYLSRHLLSAQHNNWIYSVITVYNSEGHSLLTF